ncbi:MAG: 3-methyladenine DNA glycosylase [Stictis urceolatum]|nr:3-methyladenine DNA glycosylase [Stictis urceolata]
MSTRVTRSASKPVSVVPTAPASTKIKKGTKRSVSQGSKGPLPDASMHPNPDASMPPPATLPAKRPRKTKAQSPTKSDPVASIPHPTSGRILSDLPTPLLSTSTALPPPSSPTRTPRPADPNATNATLATPRGSKYFAYPKDSSPTPSQPRPSATTADLLAKACAHLRATDPRLNAVMDAYPCPLWTPAALAEPVEPFRALVSSILAQQVSGAAATSIRKKFVGIFCGDVDEEARPKPFPTPEQVSKAEVGFLRTAGLSGRKAEYVKGVAEKFVDGELSAEWLVRASWEELYERLIAVRGLGRWSVEMFACFALKRMDVFSTGDLGVQRGLAALVGRDVKKLKAKGGGKWKYMSEKEMLEHAERFAPYR